MRRILGPLAALTLALAPGALPRASETDVAAGTLLNIYDLYLGGIKAGEMVIGVWVGADSYRGEAALQTAGVAALLYKASFTAEIAGAVEAGHLTPGRFAAQSAMSDKDQFVEMLFSAGAPATVNAEPAFIPKPWEIDPAAQFGTLDPISAAITALAPRPPEEICNRTEEIFDGRRRYAVELGPPEPHQGRIRCHATYRRIAGFKPKLMNRQTEFPFDVWYEVKPDGLAHLKRAAGESIFGLAVILARD